MKTVLLLGGQAAGQRVEVHGAIKTVFGKVTDTHSVLYHVVPMCSHGEVHWFGVLDGADPLALLIKGYGMNVVPKAVTTPPIVWAPIPAPIGVGQRPPSPYGTGGAKEGDDR